jgi:hypothetical protein
MAVLLSGINKSNAQKQESASFASYNSLGFIAGNSPIEFTAQTVNGIKYGPWFAGAGFGMDNYFIKTLPLFLSLKRDIVFENAKLFLYADVGTHFIAKDKRTSTNFDETTTKGNIYADAGLGFKFSTGKKSHAFFSLGNSFKKITQKISSKDSGFPYQYETMYKLSRISLRIGFQF